MKKLLRGPNTRFWIQCAVVVVAAMLVGGQYNGSTTQRVGAYNVTMTCLPLSAGVSNGDADFTAQPIDGLGLDQDLGLRSEILRAIRADEFQNSTAPAETVWRWLARPYEEELANARASCVRERDKRMSNMLMIGLGATAVVFLIGAYRRPTSAERQSAQ